MVYFMQSVDGGAIKIGHSSNVERRRSQLESVYGQKLVVLATRDGGRHEEREIHTKFAHLRFGDTEQFKPASDLLEFIGLPALVAVDPDSIEAMEYDPDKYKPVTAFRCTPDFKAHLEEIADSETRTPTQVIVRALQMYAEASNYEPFPKR